MKMNPIITKSILFGGAALAVRSSYERKHFKVVRYSVKSEQIPAAFDGCRIVVLADLHNQSYGHNNRRLLQSIYSLNPDLIVIAGDMVVAKGIHSLDIPLQLLKKLVRRYPVYYGLGNHERRMREETEIYGNQYQEYVDQLEKMGVTLLVDEGVDIFRGEDKIRLTGLDLPEECYALFFKRPMRKEWLDFQLGPAADEGFQMLIAHSPLYFKEYAKWGADLVFAGHYHGGTIRLPGLGGVMTPNFLFFPKYDAGKYVVTEQGKTSHMILSSGLGTHSVNIRLNNWPQLILVRLESGKKDTKR